VLAATNARKQNSRCLARRFSYFSKKRGSASFVGSESSKAKFVLTVGSVSKKDKKIKKSLTK